jgi:hypothetical protein
MARFCNLPGLPDRIRCSVVLNTTTTPAEPSLDFTSLIQPAPMGARFEDPDYFIWCASMIRDPDGLCHLFYSRWPRRLGHFAWVTHSEIARAVADDPMGPYRHVDVVLPARGKGHWDGVCTHNPTINRFEGRYYLYYMGLSATAAFRNEISMEDPAWWTYRNRQRIGVAVADSPDGPWQRFDTPCIDVSADSGAPDSLIVSNPAVTRMPDGGYLAMYKAVGQALPLPRGGPVVHLTAVASRPTGPFVKHLEPIFTATDSDFPAEDPCIWYQESHKRFYSILKDMHGSFTGKGQSLALFESTDGRHWHKAPRALVSDLNLRWEDGRVEHLRHLERPQLWHEDGQPRILFLAAARDLDHSCNVHLPLRPLSD